MSGIAKGRKEEIYCAGKDLTFLTNEEKERLHDALVLGRMIFKSDQISDEPQSRKGA